MPQMKGVRLLTRIFFFSCGLSIFVIIVYIPLIIADIPVVFVGYGHTSEVVCLPLFS